MTGHKPERLAWLIIFGAFAVFLMLCAAVPVTTQSYLLYSTTQKQGTLEVIAGTVRVQDRGAAAPIAVTGSLPTAPLSEGSTVMTDENSKAMLTLFDGSTVTLFNNTTVTLNQLRVSTFEWGRAPMAVDLEQLRGRIRVAPAPLYAPESGTAHTRSFRIKTPHLTATMDEGSYAVDVYADLSQLVVTNGTAQVAANGASVTVARGQRTVVTRGNPPLAPMAAAQDLVVNGDFRDPPDRGWNSLPDPPAGTVPGKVEFPTFGDRETVHIIRTNSQSATGQTSAITGIIQTLVRGDVSDFRTLKLTADVRLHYQSLSGGGSVSSEYPVILRLRYRDQYGSEGEWVHGFYYQNTFNNPTNNGEQVPQDVWVPFESGNLFELADPRPFYITSLQIYASGWDYEAWVSNIRLIVE